MTLLISKEFTFEASHVLPRHPGKCSRLHGHSWKLRIGVEGEVDPETGFVLDYAELSACVKVHVVDVLDHQHLGQGTAVVGINEGTEVHPPFGANFYPSSENLVMAIARILQPLIQELRKGVTLAEVSLDETCTSRATWSAIGR